MAIIIIKVKKVASYSSKISYKHKMGFGKRLQGSSWHKITSNNDQHNKLHLSLVWFNIWEVGGNGSDMARMAPRVQWSWSDNGRLLNLDDILFAWLVYKVQPLQSKEYPALENTVLLSFSKHWTLGWAHKSRLFLKCKLFSCPRH